MGEAVKQIRWTGRKKKSTEFLSKSVLFLAKYDNFAPFHFGFTEFQIRSETLLKM